MNKKLIASLLAVSLLAGLSGCGTSGDSSSKAEETSAAESSVEENSAEESVAEESVEEESSVAEADSEFAVAINGTTISQDYDGSPVLVVEYNFTNNSDEAASFVFSCDDKAFQNGIECDSTVIGCDEIDSQQEMNEIQPGTTYALKIGYHLQDTTTPVDIQVNSYDFIDEVLLLEQTITL